jgi:hypothetical protein
MDVYERIQEDDVKQASIIMASFVYHTAMRDGMLPRKPLSGKLMKVEESTPTEELEPVAVEAAAAEEAVDVAEEVEAVPAAVGSSN